MTAAENRDPGRDGWRRRQERMRYEVLLMLYRAAHAEAGRPVEAWGFAADLGVWEDELWNVVVWLEHAGMVRVFEAGRVATITLAGVRYIEEDARRRRTIRGITPPESPSN